jgi:hypothetical protein
MLLLPEGQTSETWEPSKKQVCFGIRRAWDRKVISISFRHHGHALAYAVSRRPFTARALIRLRASPWEICRGQSGTWTGFLPSVSVLPCQYHFTSPP